MLQAQRPMRDFGYRRPVHLQWRAAAEWVAAAPQRRWLWLPGSALGPCVDRGLARLVGRASREDWWLVPGTAVDAQCTVPSFADESEGGGA